MCKTDEIGEICISSISCGAGYFGLPGKSDQYFKVCPYSEGTWKFLSLSIVCSSNQIEAIEVCLLSI